MMTDDQVVEVFLGDSLEQAMAYAVAALGPDLVVHRARKVRKGMQGLVGKDRYEVLAAPGADLADGDPVESAFDALLSQAESEEEPARVRRTTRPAAAPPSTPAAETRRVPPTPSPRSPHPEPTVAEHTEHVTLLPLSLTEEPVSPPTAAAVAKRKPATPRSKPRAAAHAAATGWSRQALADLGLPVTVLDALPAQDPSDDLGWAAALAVAIATVLPLPAEVGPAAPLVVDGFGLPGVLGLLDAATRGFTPGTITSGDRRVPATAAELALVVRASLVR